MSEKAQCPKCGSWVSEAFYEQRHTFCGWNCLVRHRVEITARLESFGHAEATFGGLAERPTLEQVAAMVRGFKAACKVADGGETNIVSQVSIETEVNHEPADPQSPWFGECPPEIHSQALRVACPTCHAVVGHSCRSLQPSHALRQMKRRHPARVKLARKTAQNDKLPA